MTLQDLSKLDHAERCRNTKMPPAYVPTNKYTDKTANGLTKAVCRFITIMGGQAERINSTGRVIDDRKLVTNVLGQTGLIGSNKYIPGTSTKGTADISSLFKNKNGVLIAWKIEIKIGKDRQSEAQKKYEQDVKKAGGHYSLVRTWDDFYYQYNSLFHG